MANMYPEAEDSKENLQEKPESSSLRNKFSTQGKQNRPAYVLFRSLASIGEIWLTVSQLQKMHSQVFRIIAMKPFHKPCP